MTKDSANKLLIREANKRLKTVRTGNTKGKGGTIFSLSSFIQGGMFIFEILTEGKSTPFGPPAYRNEEERE